MDVYLSIKRCAINRYLHSNQPLMEKRLTVSCNESYILLILNYIHKSYDGTIREITMRDE